MTKPDIGARIRDARERAGLTQQQLADKVGATRTSVGNWEAGVWPRNSVGRLREVLDLDERLMPRAATSLADMTDSELMAHLNSLTAQVNAASMEIASRLAQR